MELTESYFWGEQLVNRVIWFFFYPMDFYVATYQLLGIFIFSNFAYKKCWDLFFAFGFL